MVDEHEIKDQKHHSNATECCIAIPAPGVFWSGLLLIINHHTGIGGNNKYEPEIRDKLCDSTEEEIEVWPAPPSAGIMVVADTTKNYAAAQKGNKGKHRRAAPLLIPRRCIDPRLLFNRTSKKATEQSGIVSAELSSVVSRHSRLYAHPSPITGRTHVMCLV